MKKPLKIIGKMIIDILFIGSGLIIIVDNLRDFDNQCSEFNDLNTDILKN